MSTHDLGAAAESLVAAHLESLGYRILARNYRLKHLEIDLIAEDGGVLCFVEVRARSRRDFGHAIETVDARKRRRLVTAATRYLSAHGKTNAICRFDVVGVDTSGPDPVFTLIKDAFRAE